MSEAAAEQTRGRRKTLVGTVVSVKMDKTAVVAVERRYPHPLYHKIIRSTKRYKAHDPNNAAVLGDTVRIVESRPISKEKRWRIMETMTRGNVAELQPREIAVPDEAGPMRQAPVAATPSTTQVAAETPETPAVAPASDTVPTTAEVADETPMTSDSTVLAAASDDMDPRDYAATPGAPALDADETASTAANVTPDLTVPERDEPAESAAEAASDETSMTSDSDVLAAAADDMDAKDFQPDAKDEEEDKA